MKFRTLLLGTAAAFAMAGGAQAADLAVAAPGGSICGDGWFSVPGTSFCIKIAARVREIASFGDTWALTTKTKILVAGMTSTEWGDAGIVIPIINNSNDAESRQFTIDTGTHLYVGPVEAGWDAMPGPGGGIATDNDGFHPDSGGEDYFRYIAAMGGFTAKFTVAEANNYLAWDHDMPQLNAQLVGAIGGLATTLAFGWVPQTTGDGWYVNGSIQAALGPATIKVLAGYSVDAPGGVTNSAPYVGGAGTVWVANASFKLPLGAINTLGGTVSYQNWAGATNWRAVADLAQQWNSAVDTREEVTYDNATGDIGGFFWLTVAINAP